MDSVASQKAPRPYPDRAFRVSGYGAWRLMSESQACGMSAAQYFRRKARALGQSVGPQFTVRGASLDREFRAGIHPSDVSKLHSVADNLRVPHRTICELVACWNAPEGAI